MELDSPRIIFWKNWEPGVLICEELGLQVCNWTEGMQMHTQKEIKIKKIIEPDPGFFETRTGGLSLKSKNKKTLVETQKFVGCF